ncbi:hypothetical protein BD560DRAFT_486322 [Blakeslea trispora]|nr:hypothetical protein BD560DRAFT_486322 [Blakeslea trispora]
MKSATLSSPEDKRIVRDALKSSIIFTAAVARLYVAVPSDTWKYSGLWGAVAFCKDKLKKNSYFLRIVDIEYHKGVVWEQELYLGFEYTKDCPFFYTFSTDDCLAGLLFVHQREADDFFNKVVNRESLKLKKNNITTHKYVKILFLTNMVSKKEKHPLTYFSKFSMYSDNDFKVSFIAGRGFSVSNNDPEVLAILHELEKLGNFSAADIEANQGFIQDFIRKYKMSTKSKKRLPPPPPPPSVKNKSKTRPPPPPPPLTDRPAPTKRYSAPPPPPPPPPPPLPLLMGSRQTQMKRYSAPPPPPPLFNRSIRQSPSIASLNSPTLLTPPSTAPSTPMLTYTKPSPSITSRPPTPISIPPLPPSLPVGATLTKKPSSPPPPPPPPPPTSLQKNMIPLSNQSTNIEASSSPSLSATNNKDSRNDLLAAIRSTGGFGSLKRSGTLKTVSVNEKNGLNASSNVEANGMTASLAAVLQKRKTVMQSDDESEEEDDDDWD